MTIITPTVGRVVWFYPNPGSKEHAAIVTAVHGDRMVNLFVMGPTGDTSTPRSVPLLQEGDARPTSGFFCTWMPYQLGQAKKHVGEFVAQNSAGI